jgi:hypothetical protein
MPLPCSPHLLPVLSSCALPVPPALPYAAVKVAKRELKMECDYRYELQSQQRFKQLIAADPYTSQVGGRAECVGVPVLGWNI